MQVPGKLACSCMQHVRPPPQRLLADAPADPHACAEKEKDVKSEEGKEKKHEEKDVKSEKKDEEMDEEAMKEEIRHLFKVNRPDRDPDGRMKPPEPVHPPTKPPESLFWRQKRSIPMAKRFKRGDEGEGGGMRDTHATHDMHEKPRVPSVPPPPPKPAVPPAPWWPPPPPPPVFRAKGGKARTHHACACIHTCTGAISTHSDHACQRLPQDGHPAGKVPILDMETLSMHACMHEN